jgi:hypothetical protein
MSSFSCILDLQTRAQGYVNATSPHTVFSSSMRSSKTLISYMTMSNSFDTSVLNQHKSFASLAGEKSEKNGYRGLFSRHLTKP